MSKHKFKNLTEEEKQYIIHIYHEDMLHKEKMRVLTKKFGVTERTIRNWWKEKLNLSEHFSKLPPQLVKASKRGVDNNTKILLVTSAQNKTGVHQAMLDNMETYASFLTRRGFKTQIVVTPSRYRNPTSPTEDIKKDSVQEWWRDEVLDYLYYGKIHFGDSLISADSRVRPTAKEPLTGFEVMAKDKHLVIPHSKIHYKTLPRFKGDPLRTMCTTGFCTHKNYSDSKAGDLAFENHSYGFVVVEMKDDDTCFPLRNVKVTSEGDFVDILYHVKDETVTTIDYSEGFVWGDIHSKVINRDFLEVTKNLLQKLKPYKQVLHDVYDGSNVNPHEKKDMFILRQKIIRGDHLVEEEVEESLDLVEEIHNNLDYCDTYATISNHDVFLDRFINDENWKKDLHNSPTYLKYAHIQQTVDLRECGGGIYGYLFNQRFNGSVEYINYGESLKICGYETGAHGDFGINGAKGSYKSFSRLNTKMIHAHQHSPAIHNGVTVVGVTCHIHQYYNRRGLSSWAYAHSVIHPNCKNQLLVFNDDYGISNLV